ncbi:TetR family transcriptional regulator [Glycomyces sp. A-F 0318]|uniref:acyl-CoA-like ligand-binding transcription factor n=1 Tax=Glycomyces amatae TaxID=2881355 RepID=UPI001E449BDF|nr:TetR family transcriptional regulator [Glycomyces amatae]MCD0443948.1 TetR family transcriptional regulator [Glycomyces amatae]
MDSTDDAPASAAPGLQARKKLAAMHRIQEAALDLFEERGFDDVAIEEVAAAAEVSPRTVYRYFGSKETLVIWDEEDEPAVSPLAPQFAAEDPVGALREAMRAGFAALGPADLRLMRRRVALVYRHPGIEAALILHAYEKSRRIAAAVAPDADRALEVQVFAHACVGAVLGAMRHWCLSEFARPPYEFVDRALTLLEHGFTAPDRKRAHP